MSKFKPYPEYKDSSIEWLGSVPKHWVIMPLKFSLILNPSKSSYMGSLGIDCSFIPMENLKTGALQLNEKRKILDVFYNYTYFENNDVLQAKVTPCFENKNVAIAKGLVNGIGFGSSEINVLRPKDNIMVNFLYYRVQETNYMVFCISNMVGAAGLKRVPSEVIKNFKIGMPDIEEQKQIALFLNHETARMDELIAEQKRLIELLKEKRQAVISHAVTKGLDPNAPMKDSGIEWLGEVPEHWQVVRLRFLCKIKTGDQDTQDAIDEGKYPFFVRSEKIQRSGKVTFEGEGVLTSGDGAGVGEIYHYFKGKMAIHQRVYLFYDFKRIVALFFFYYLRSQLKPVVLSQSAKSTVDSLRLPMLQNFVLCMPPKEEQMQIIERIDSETKKIDALIQEAEKAIDLMNERRSALISAAVTGKIDVRDWQPEKEQVEALAS